MAAQKTLPGTTAPTTIAPAAALDEFPALQAALFTAYGTFYQQINQAQAMR